MLANLIFGENTEVKRSTGQKENKCTTLTYGTPLQQSQEVEILHLYYYIHYILYLCCIPYMVTVYITLVLFHTLHIIVMLYTLYGYSLYFNSQNYNR